MPKLTKKLPSYRRHKRSGQAIVNLSGKDFYLGPHGTKASKAEYDRLIGEWLANGRVLPESRTARAITVSDMIAVLEVCEGLLSEERQADRRDTTA